MADAFNDNGFGLEDSGTPQFSPEITRGTVQVNKQTYAIGLYWEGVGDNDAAAHARERADNADFYCVYKAPLKTQVGFGNRAQGHKSNLPSLAIHLASGRVGKFLALFDLGDGFYILGVRDDGINPMLERFVATREEAMDLYEDAKGDLWDEMIAPNSFGWKDTTELHIDDCLKGRAPARLKEINRRGHILKIVLGLAIIGVSIFGFQLWEKQSAEEQARILAELEAKAAASKDAITPGQKKVEIPEAPWVNKTMGSHFLKKCVEDVMEFPLDVPGWKVRQFICENPLVPTVAAVLMRDGLGRGGAPINWIAPFVKTSGYTPNVLQNSNGSSDMISAQWQMFADQAPKVPLDQETIPVAQVKTKLVQIMEERFTPVTTSAANIDDFYRGLTFEFETTLDPRGYLDVISAIPGSVIQTAEYDLETKIWKIKGNSYEQLPPPVQID